VAGTADTTITYNATDDAGNVESTKTYTVKRDNNAPTTTLTSNPVANANGYNLTAPTITLAAADAETAVASITYTVGSAAAITVNQASVSFPVSAPGSTQISYSATDAAGNVEATGTYTVRRDTSAPTVATVTSPDPSRDYKLGNNGAQSWSRTCGSRSGICGTATDAESGISSMTYRLVKGTTCYNGSSFVTTATSGTSCNVLMTYDSVNSDWFGGIDKSELSPGNYSVTVTATNGAGDTRTSAAVAFTASN
jgi:hypothetical protein